MIVILENTASGRLVFQDPLAVITAHAAAEVPGALAAIEHGLAAGHHVAGWLAYELGYALEPKLARLMPAPSGPLLGLGVFEGPAADARASHGLGRAYAGPLMPEWDEAAYASRFARVADYIAAGDIYQANLSFRARFAFAGDARALYERLRCQSGAPHCGYVDDGARQILSLSPELFFDLSADGVLTARPMKGTAPRRGDDAAGRAALAASEKDRAENLMIVDLIRNDLGRIAEISSVAVPELFRVETYPTLHTMVSTVTARRKAGAGVSEIIAALFPCGSVTGAPKLRAMEILRELESSPRGAYCGAIGHLAPSGTARFNVAIRTLTISQGRGVLGIGGGVVRDSRGPNEYAECLLKARFFEAGRRPLELIETLRWDKDFVRLARHLARMAGSASVFGLRFDPTAAQAALDEAVKGATAPQRVRLTLNEAGTHHASAQALAPNPASWHYAVSRERIDSGDLLYRHKTDWRELYEREMAERCSDEVLFLNERGELAEGARSNLFVRRGDIWLTPPLDAGVLPGCLRAELLACGAAREATLTEADLVGEVYFGNSLRGLIPARRV